MVGLWNRANDRWREDEDAKEDESGEPNAIILSY